MRLVPCQRHTQDSILRYFLIVGISGILEMIVCTPVYTYTHVFGCACIDNYTYIYTCIYIYIYIYVYTCVSIQINICVYLCIYVYLNVYVYIYIYRRVCTHVHKYMHLHAFLLHHSAFTIRHQYWPFIMRHSCMYACMQRNTQVFLYYIVMKN